MPIYCRHDPLATGTGRQQKGTPSEPFRRQVRGQQLRPGDVRAAVEQPMQLQLRLQRPLLDPQRLDVGARGQRQEQRGRAVRERQDVHRVDATGVQLVDLLDLHPCPPHLAYQAVQGVDGQRRGR